MRLTKLLLSFICVILLVSCGGNDGAKGKIEISIELKSAPVVNADSAYAFVQAQVDFGPRVPNTQAHRDASKWFKKKF